MTTKTAAEALEELRQKAMAATKGPWHDSDPTDAEVDMTRVWADDGMQIAHVYEDWALYKDQQFRKTVQSQNAAYIAAASPEVILALLDELAQLRAHPPATEEGREAVAAELNYAQELAASTWRKHYQTDAPEWKVLPDMYGVLSQIDNMLTGLSRAPAQQPAQGEERERFEAWLETTPDKLNFYEIRLAAYMAGAALPSQPEQEPDKVDAERWRVARQYLSIEDIEAWSIDMLGHKPSEEESLRTDHAIDQYERNS